MKGVSSKRKLQILLLLLVISSVLCLLIIIKRKKHEKLTDYHFFKDDNRFFWDKRYVDSKEEETKVEEIVAGKYIPPRRVVHIDMKGAPPRLPYLISLFPTLSKAGATDLLLEYEDMFPFWGPLANISARNAYTIQDIASLLHAAKENNMTVIPLVQTFGHMEWVLKLERFKNLREEPHYPGSVCPSREGTMDLLRLVLTQVMEVHAGSSHLHIGCDEVFQLGTCSQCVQRINKVNTQPGSAYYNTRMLFLDHVKAVASFVNRKGKTPIMWDDMLRNMPRSEIKDSSLGNIVELMVWSYVDNIDTYIDYSTWRTYSELFRGVWAASAFKGATGERQHIPDILSHVRNQIAWLQVMERESQHEVDPVKFKGLALTGWSRYDHFAVLCELLPASLPSLVVNLMVASLGGLQFPVSRRIHNLLGCDNIKMLISIEELRRNPYQWDLTRCSWSGVRLFTLVANYNLHRTEVDRLHSGVIERSAWMSAWNVRHSFSSPWRVKEIMKTSLYLPQAVRELDTQARRVLPHFYDNSTTSEWIEQNILPLSEKLTQVLKYQESLSDRDVWPRRPV